MADTDVKKVDDCWNRIGVWAKGEKSCPELERVIHCANCEIFSRAGRRLLESDAPEGYLEQWSQLLAQEQRELERDTQSVILFRLGDEWMGISVTLLDEVVPMKTVHRVPHRNNPVLKGLINVRGELQICVSLGSLMKITKGDISGTDIVKGIYERMIVISYDGSRYVFPVSEIKGVHRYREADLKHAPATAVNCAANYLKGMLVVEEKHVGLIDHELLFPALEKGIL